MESTAKDCLAILASPDSQTELQNYAQDKTPRNLVTFEQF